MGKEKMRISRELEELENQFTDFQEKMNLYYAGDMNDLYDLHERLLQIAEEAKGSNEIIYERAIRLKNEVEKWTEKTFQYYDNEDQDFGPYMQDI